MTILQAIILGIVQGATEFLPISSSGHLVLLPHLLGWNIPSDQAFIFDVWVQLGTLMAVIIYFWKELFWITYSTISSIWNPSHRSRPEVRLGGLILLATVPAVIAGVLLKDWVEAAFSNPVMTAFFLLVTAMMLVFAERVGQRNMKLDKMTWRDALWIGFFQIVSLFPGVSRSGATITGGMLRNLERRQAARFSFLMSVPVMIGAAVYTGFDLIQVNNQLAFAGQILAGFITSAVIGYIAIRWLIVYLSENPLYLFSIYLVVISALILIFT